MYVPVAGLVTFMLDNVGAVVSAVILFPVLLALVTVQLFPTLSVMLPPVNVFIANTPLSPAVIVYV